MKTGPQMSTLLQNLQAKVETQSQETEEQTQQMLHDFEQHLTQALNAAQRKIARDLESLEKLSAQIHRRTAAQIEDQAETIREAMSDLDASRTQWRTVTWKTMLPTYLAGVLLTSWILLMAVQLTFPNSETTSPQINLATFGLEGTRVSRGLGGMGRVLSLPEGVELADCPVLNPGGGTICIETRVTR
jgi:type VI protein secretion system component VasF